MLDTVQLFVKRNESFVMMKALDTGGAGRLAEVVASNVRRHRERRRLSLSELAARAGVGKSTLSQIESGRANPSMETLWAIATALGAPFGELVSPHAPEVRVVRSSQGIRVDSEGAPFLVRLLAGTGRRGAAELYAIEADPGTPRTAEPHPAGVVEHLLVMAGAMEAGPLDAPVTLAAGDLATFPADVPHAYRALEPGTAAVLLMDYP
jgi:transcriptional regulator with XRE-family HTH domain